MHSIFLALLGALATQASSSALAPEDIRFCPNHAGRTPVEIRPEILTDDGSVYPVGSRRWNEEWEIRFADWVEKNVGADFFIDLGIPTDCADAAITIRMIFARIHHLPVVFQGGGIKISFENRRFSKLATVPHWNETHWRKDLRADARFLAFVNWVQSGVGTKNLAESTYPLSLFSCGDPQRLAEHVRAGNVLLSSGHTRFIAKKDTLNPFVPVQELQAGGGRQVKTLHGGSISIEWPTMNYGILGYNWAVDCGRGFVLVPDESMPFYGLDQYDRSDETMQQPFNDFIQRIAPGSRSPDVGGYVRIKFSELRQTVLRRLEAVEKANRILRRDPRAFDDTKSVLHDDLSTPSLDAKLLQQWRDIHSLIQQSGSEGARQVFAALMERRIRLSTGETFTYDLFIALLLEDENAVLEHRSEISDPRRPLSERWGVERMEALRLDRVRGQLMERMTQVMAEYESTLAALRRPGTIGLTGIPVSMNPALERRRQVLRQEIRELAREMIRLGFSSDQMKEWAK